MKKSKLFSKKYPIKEIRKYPNKDVYIFKKGIAIVSGMKIHGQPVTITLKEFNDYINN